MPIAHRTSRRGPNVTRCALLLVGALCAVGRVSAQSAPSVFVQPGERVRVTTQVPSSIGATRIGVLQWVARDSVVVDFTGGEREALALDRLRRLEVSDGRGNFVARGMGYGFVAGGLIGVAAGVAVETEGNDYISRPVIAAVTGIVGGLAGTVVGGVIGALVRREKWTTVRLEPPLRRVSLTPFVMPGVAGASHGGVQVGIRF